MVPQHERMSSSTARAGLRHRQGRRRQDDRRRWRSALGRRARRAGASCCARWPGRRAPPRSTAPTPPRPAREIAARGRLWATTIDPVLRARGVGRAPDRLAPARRAADALQRLRGLRQRRAGRARARGDHQGVGARPRASAGSQGARRLRPRGRRRPGQRPRRRDAAHAAHVRRDRARRADRLAGAQGRDAAARTRRAARSSPWPCPAELPVTETLELEERVAAPSGARSTPIVVNGVLPRRFSAADVERVAAARRRASRPRWPRRRAASTGRPAPSRASCAACAATRARTWPRCPTSPGPHLGLAEVRGAGDELARRRLGGHRTRSWRVTTGSAWGAACSTAAPSSRRSTR